MTDRALIVAPEPGALTTKQILDGLNTVRGVLAPDLSDDELRLFAMVANRSGLDPFAKQVYAVKRKGRVTFQTGIDGYRSTAARTGEYLGSDEPEFGEMIDKPIRHPEWARTVVHRRMADGTLIDQSATAWWDEFCPGEGQDTMWRKMPRNQLAKCSEALALRKAFPFVLSDVYTTEEMDQANRIEPAVTAAPTAAERIAERVAARRAQTVAATMPVTDEAAAQEIIEGEVIEEAGGLGTRRDEAAGEVPSAPVAPSTCGAQSPFGDTTCDRPAGHKGVHRVGTEESWPQ